MSLDSDPKATRGLLSWTVKVTFAAGVAAALLGHYVARTIEPGAALVAARDLDPMVTGSIGPAAKTTALTTALDPCALRGR